ncbi:MAG: polysaccharide biosynthesis/export family protein [Planctomycetaceae bacterium]|nr:polysaccharide biosynthesis/export family protein [Planctomycetaceae bacterium]
MKYLIHSANQQGIRLTLNRWSLLCPLALLGLFASGCTALVSPIQTIPASRVPPELLAIPVANDRVIDYARLRQAEPEEHILDSDDVLGVHIENLFAGEDPNAPQIPPVTMPEPGSDLSPGIGLPYPVRDDGTISMPFVGPIAVKGLTLAQAEEVIGRVYVEKNYLREGQRPIVTLIRKRTYKVFVIRQDNNALSNQQNGLGFQFAQRAVAERADLSSRGFVLQLPAYRNDLLNALTETGGLPGINAKAEVKILRSDKLDPRKRDEMLREFYLQFGTSNVGGTLPPLPDDPNVVKVPLRLKPGQFPKFSEQDIILKEGDVVLVETRDTEVYYTGGLLNPGEFLLPRDKDTDVLNAVAIAGGGIGAFQQGGGFAGGLGGGIGSVPPSQLIIMRPLPGNRQIAIEVDLTRAINDPRERLLVKPGDTLILRHKPREEVLNFSIGAFFTYGLRELFN